MKVKGTIVCLMMFLAATVAQAQIIINGNVYGGGNKGDLSGSTKVVVRAGDIDGSVFAGARQANIEGSAFVNIDGEHISDDILINYVYGGNDIAGTIGTSQTLPTGLTKTTENGIDNTYNAFVLTTKEKEAAANEEQHHIYIGQLFGGGNGDYDYSEGSEYHGMTRPELDKTYIEMRGGSCVILYGGGNNATVKEATDICIDNPSAVTNHIYQRDPSGNLIENDAHDKLQDNARLKRMGVYALGGAAGASGFVTSAEFQFSRVFGGNNKAPMGIRPKWHLTKGKIRNLYSGGNQGAMTHEQGIFLSIASADMEVGNVYGGCRMADVNPDKHQIQQEEIEGVLCPPGYAARVNIAAGTIGNVYGGNDISGTVYGGSAVGIHSSVNGDVYGGGNGSYLYTDNDAFKHIDGVEDTEAKSLYGDYFYDVKSILNLSGNTFTGLQSAEALNKFRPHAEAVSVRLISNDQHKPTVIGGSVYCGGNSATLRTSRSGINATAELKIGSYVYADNVFLGSNGENMVTKDMLKQLAGNVTIEGNSYDFSQIDLKVYAQMEEYMKGCEMDVRPSVVFDKVTNGSGGYVPHSTYFGSFYCGGNVGSVNIPGMNTLNFDQDFIIYNKLVGGCNNAYVPVKYDDDGTTALNAAYDGGLIANPDPTTKNKLTINLSRIKIQPMRWKVARNANYEVIQDNNGKVSYLPDVYGNRQLEWNTISASTGKETAPVTEYKAFESDDLDRRLKNGHVYGGCYSSGHINGNIIINIEHTLMDPSELFDHVAEDEEGEAILYGDSQVEGQQNYTIKNRRTGVILGEQGMDVLGSALNIYGGGKGKATEIWGSTTINHKGGYVFQIFGGSEEGVIGKGETYNGTQIADNTYEGGYYYFNGKRYQYNADYSCTINLKGQYDGVTKKSPNNNVDMSDCEFIYGGGFLGPICGNTIINLGKGRIFNSFAGSCNADILGHTETWIGRQINDDGSVNANGGFPYVRDYVYGGNDLGGRILKTADFSSRIRDGVDGVPGLTLPGKNAATEVSAYTEYTQGRVRGIFGGCYGTYNYKESEYSEFFDNTGTAKPGYTKPRMDNAFVNFRPTATDALMNNSFNKVWKIYGSGQGYPGDADRDIMQERSYILIDIPQSMTNYSEMEVFGAGAWSGLGMLTYVAPTATPTAEQLTALNKVSAIIDLPRGQINAVYGASYEEGFTRRAVINVPEKSTIKLNKIFGGAYGVSNDVACDAYETHVNWNSVNARVGSLYGGNNNARRTLYGQVNVNAPVWTDTNKGWMATVYGAGYGADTWSQYTEVNLNKGSQVYQVYGGGENGRVANVATATQEYTAAKLKIADPYTVGNNTYTYADNGLNNDLAKPRHDGNKYNTNVIINKGAVVGAYADGYQVNGGYAYGGGMGTASINRSGDVNGTTYIALLGGVVEKDIYAAGSVGSVFDRFGGLTDDFGNTFKASTTAYIAAGIVRNAYGGGYMGSVGKHKTLVQLKDANGNVVLENNQPVMIEADAELNASTTGDILADSHVIIGIREDQTSENLTAAMNYLTTEAATNGSVYGVYNGVPAIQRNAYGGGEGETNKGGRGGAVYGVANVVLNNGRIGYDYINNAFIEKLNDETWTVSDSIGRLKDYGNIFGGGYSDKSNVDETRVEIWGGIVRGSVHGGAEIAAIGRGYTAESGEANHIRVFGGITKPGKTLVEMYNGHVLRNIFGGGKGYNVLGFGGANDLYTDGYVFGQTEVHIHGGEIGTVESVRAGFNYGNVFGGGDLGYVYSKGYDNSLSRVTGTGLPNHYYYYYNDGTGNNLIEDCKVVISPWLQVKSASATINGKTKAKYEYFETDDLNTLPKDKSAWTDLYTGDKDANGNDVPGDTKERGVLIHNAVFGGGNVSSNSDTHYANATTVFGNTTATLYDCYHRDFITIGTEHTGGLYGGGNLSVVDGYRELNITNYGTDYYGMDDEITLADYKKLSNRERAYFQLEYVCKNPNGVTIGEGQFQKTYAFNDRVKEDDFEKLKTQTGYNAADWEQYGFCSIYAGRLLNTIQRADLCGVFGSRMVLQGAKDRVAEVGEDIDYTINRVGELSLNKQKSVRTSDTGDDASHGNYFGIYSIVNYLGNLTSDVRFGDTYLDSDGHAVAGKTYYSYKSERPDGVDRNYGTSPNKVALASGVFLELITENSTEDNKDYGYVTGVIELDLINVKRAVDGGGFVYAKNEHRVPKYYKDKPNVVLSEYNKPKTVGSIVLRDEVRTYKRYRYATPAQETADGLTDHDPRWADSNWSAYESTAIVISGDNEHVYKTMEIETSGNFIHPNKKRIVDDCYPINNAYVIGSSNFSKAHYWYVKGAVYVYDQVVSAYTGSSGAYSKDVRIPLTITAASNGRLKLLNVKPNLYAYYFESGKKIGTNGNDGKAWVNNNADMYQLNDVISWWDWNNLSPSDQALFVPETYVNYKPCKIDGTNYATGEYVLLPSEVSSLKTNHTITDTEGNAFTNDQNQVIPITTLVDDLFRTSNDISHTTGYLLTFDMDTPKVWDDYYSPVSGASTYTISGNTVTTTRKTKEEYNDLPDNASTQEDKTDYVEGPTFHPNYSGDTPMVYGQRDYAEGDILTKADYQKMGSGQENVDIAYVATKAVTYTYNNTPKTVNPGTAIPKTEYDALVAAEDPASSGFALAYVCINSIKLDDSHYLLNGELMTAAEITRLKGVYSSMASDIEDSFTDAYICKVTGKYGGQTYSNTMNYSAIESFCSLSAADRTHFDFNYDALDLLSDPTYSVETTGGMTVAQAYKQPYSEEVPVEYKAVYDESTTKTLQKQDGTTAGTFTKGAANATISSADFENIRNDKRYYTLIETGAGQTDAYIAKTNFTYKGMPYGKGQVVDADVATANSSVVDHITNLDQNTSVYYCYEAYSAGGTAVAKGTKITPAVYGDLYDDQKYFVIQGQGPTGTTTLYVNSESDIRNLTKEKIITVVYQYSYYENGDNGDVKLTNELHVVNIHLQLESGAPSIGTLNEPPIVLPGTAVGLDRPEVRAGIYEVLINGWELYSSKTDAEHHRNGVEFTNNKTPVYWYMNEDHYISFYSKTYLGKTYSNYVPIRVANYHDLGELMERYKENHLYIDRPDVDRPAKIYINDYMSLTGDDPRKGKNSLDELKRFFDLSVQSATATTDNDGLISSGDFVGHAPLGNHVRGAGNLDFILRTDISHTKTETTTTTDPITEETTTTTTVTTLPWTTIASGPSDPCFGGNLHGDGHTITDLSSSLFGKLCGSVYNLGVTGSFTGAGIAEEGDGFVENCWIKSSATALPANQNAVQAVFGNPSDPDHPGCIQVLNCYYPESNSALYDAASVARKMSDKAFYDGTVAYNLNGYYLGKRLYDGNQLGEGEGNKSYKYLKANADGSLPTNEQGKYVTTQAYYPEAYAYYTPQIPARTAGQLPKLGYVEHRFFDGDFIYAGGNIPESYNIRRQETNEYDTNFKPIVTWAPIWPDDYLFFGQTLTYGHVEGRAHQDLPTMIKKSSERLLTDDGNNRVYRAPAYFRSGDMKEVHFNSNAIFAQAMQNDDTKVVHKDMTAIDFTGGNGDVAGDYLSGWQTAAPYNHLEGGAFYPPLLDDGGLTAFRNVDLTKNLLAYTGTKSAEDATQITASEKTANVVSARLHDYAYAEGDATGDGYVAGKDIYRTVAEWDRTSHYDNMQGHWVQKSGSNYISTLDHFLVDLQDFNAPIGYQFDSSHRMWYQRTPDLYVELTKGWEGISLPFTAELATTHQKGEMTHFFTGSTTGHEYWLRMYRDISGVAGEDEIQQARFTYPDATDGLTMAKTGDDAVTNTFLWDYYYEGAHDHLDANSDVYQDKNKMQRFYSVSRTYDTYPLLTASKPYIIGFPGTAYYEFDLSGDWTAQTTGLTAPAKLARQIVTFASAKGATIGVSDSELTGTTANGYTFKPSYLNETFAAGTAGTYTMDAVGDSYDLIPKQNNEGTVPATNVGAFRPYFVKVSGARPVTRSIIFSQENSQLKGVEEHGDLGDEETGSLDIYAKKHKIVVESNLREVTDVRIVNTAGITVNTFTIEPGEKVVTRVNISGVYIVQTTDGKYNKKLAVK